MEEEVGRYVISKDGKIFMVESWQWVRGCPLQQISETSRNKTWWKQ